MKELKRTVTTETVWGYEANDGTVFSSKEECEKYEQSARCVIRQHVKDILFREWQCDSLFHGFNYDDHIKVWFIKDENTLCVVNQYLHNVDPYARLITPDYIGLRVAVVVNVDEDYATVLGTYNEILLDFTNQLNKLFADPAPTSNT